MAALESRREQLADEIQECFGAKDAKNADWLNRRAAERMATGGGSSLFAGTPEDPLRQEHIVAAIYADMKMDGVNWKQEASSLQSFLGRYAPEYDPYEEEAPAPVTTKPFYFSAHCYACKSRAPIRGAVVGTWLLDETTKTYSCVGCDALERGTTRKTAREFIDGLTMAEWNSFRFARARLHA
jgi:hypothetical protein